MTPISTPLAWAHDKQGIVDAYREYLMLMDHWSRLIPSDRLLHVDYEELARNPEESTRRIVDFCCLAWSDACLQPEKNDRAVATPSAWQVRQPINTKAVEKWRRFEPWLGEFRELLPKASS